MLNKIGVDVLKQLATTSKATENEIRKHNTAPEAVRQLKMRVNHDRAASILGVKNSTLSSMRNLSGAPAGEIRGKYRFYSLEDLEQFRALMVERGRMKNPPRHGPDQRCMVLSVSNLKGGVSKTTLSTNLATHFALHGFRTLLIDLDPQSSASEIMDPRSQFDIDVDETIAPALVEDPNTLSELIRPTAWSPLLNIVPAMRDLSAFESRLSDYCGEGVGFWELMGKALDTVKDDYDIILFDTHPTLEQLELSAIWASDMLLVPCSASWVDVRALSSFLFRLSENIEAIEEASEEKKEFDAVRMLITNYKADTDLSSEPPKNATVERMVAGMMRRLFGEHLAESIFAHSTAFQSAALNMTTIHDSDRGAKSHKKAYEDFFKLGNEIIDLILASRAKDTGGQS